MPGYTYTYEDPEGNYHDIDVTYHWETGDTSVGEPAGLYPVVDSMKSATLSPETLMEIDGLIDDIEDEILNNEDPKA